MSSLAPWRGGSIARSVAARTTATPEDRGPPSMPIEKYPVCGFAAQRRVPARRPVERQLGERLESRPLDARRHTVRPNRKRSDPGLA